MDHLIDILKLDRDKPIVLANQDGLILFVNTTFETFFQWSSDEIINQPLLVIIPTHLHDAHNLGLSRFITTQRPILLDKPLNLPVMKKNGEQVNAIHLIRAIKEKDVWIFGANISPVKE